MQPGTRRISSSLSAFAVAALLAACTANQPPSPAATTGSAPSSSIAAGSQQEMPPLPPAGSTSPPSPRPAGMNYPVATFFVPGYPNIVEVQIRDKQGASEVSLVAPDGKQTDAYQLDTTTQVASTGYRTSGAGFGLGVGGSSGGDVGAGIGIGIPLFGFGSSGSSQANTEVLTRARVRIPDATAYRADWKRWVVRILFDAGAPTERRLEMAAPPPPPA